MVLLISLQANQIKYNIPACTMMLVFVMSLDGIGIRFPMVVFNAMFARDYANCGKANTGCVLFAHVAAIK